MKGITKEIVLAQAERYGKEANNCSKESKALMKRLEALRDAGKITTEELLELESLSADKAVAEYDAGLSIGFDVCREAMLEMLSIGK